MAEDDFAEALRFDLPPELQAEIYHKRSAARIKRDDFEGALDDSTRILELNGAPPNQVGFAKVSRTICLSMLGRFRECLAEIQSLYASDVEAPDGVRVSLACILMDRFVISLLHDALWSEWVDQETITSDLPLFARSSVLPDLGRGWLITCPRCNPSPLSHSTYNAERQLGSLLPLRLVGTAASTISSASCAQASPATRLRTKACCSVSPAKSARSCAKS